MYFALSDKGTGKEFYDRHWELIRENKMNRRNTDDLIYTPGVVVVRDDVKDETMLKEEDWYQVDVDAGVYSLIPALSLENFIPPSLAPTLFKFNFEYIATDLMSFIAVVFAFLFVDLFDTVGTLVGVADQGNLLDKDGKLPRVGRALTCDAVGTVVGSALGTSTVTSYVESTAGVAAGGRTGLTAVSSAVMFVLALFLSPIFLAIPSFATCPALVFVGLLMIKSVQKMKLEGDIADVLGGFVALIFMPFTYSIANGIMYGILVWVILKVFTGKIKDIHPIMWISSALFAVRIFRMGR